MCTIPFPALSLVYLEPLRQQKGGVSKSQGPTAPPLQGTGVSDLGPGKWLRDLGSWEEPSGIRAVFRALFLLLGGPLPFFPPQWPRKARSLSSSPSIKPVPRKEKNPMPLLTGRNKTAGGIFRLAVIGSGLRAQSTLPPPSFLSAPFLLARAAHATGLSPPEDAHLPDLAGSVQ